MAAITDVIFVEDGSVDVDQLKAELASTTKIIVYRQGTSAPIISHLDYPIELKEDEIAKIERKVAYDILSELSKAVDEVRYQNEEEINGKFYIDSTTYVGELSIGVIEAIGRRYGFKSFLTEGLTDEHD